MHQCSTSTELFAFFSLEVVRLPLAESNEQYATHGNGVLSSPADSYCVRLFHVRKRRPTLVYFWMRQMLCKRSVTRRFTEAGSKQEHRNTQTDYCRNTFLNTKDNEFYTAAISLLWHAPPVLCCGQFNVADIRRR